MLDADNHARASATVVDLIAPVVGDALKVILVPDHDMRMMSHVKSLLRSTLPGFHSPEDGYTPSGHSCFAFKAFRIDQAAAAPVEEVAAPRPEGMIGYPPLAPPPAPLIGVVVCFPQTGLDPEDIVGARAFQLPPADVNWLRGHFGLGDDAPVMTMA